MRFLPPPRGLEPPHHRFRKGMNTRTNSGRNPQRCLQLPTQLQLGLEVNSWAGRTPLNLIQHGRETHLLVFLPCYFVPVGVGRWNRDPCPPRFHCLRHFPLAIKVGSTRNYLRIQRSSPTLRKFSRFFVAFPEVDEMRFSLPDRVSFAPRAFRGSGSFCRPLTCCWIVRLLITACFSLTLNVAAASCGDYLNGMAEEEGFLVQAHETNPTDLPLIQPKNPRKPRGCSGPACHQAPAIPMDQPQPFSICSPLKDLCLDCQRIAVTEEIWVGVEPRSELERKSPDSVRLERPPQLG